MDAVLTADEHVCRIIGIHFDPEGGTPYWLERERDLGIDARRQIRTLEDLHRLGPMDEDALRSRPMLDFVPLSQRGNLAGAITAETGGTTGRPKRTIFSPEEFQEAFVRPFVRVAQQTGFPSGGLWLWAGPSGPHIIGQAAAACASALGSPQPLAIDFDPRWAAKLPAESLARQRYLTHLLNQAVDILQREPISVIFTTPVILEQLATVMSTQQRRQIRGVHYGGMRVEPQLLHSAQTDWFPDAVHLAGYGNSLFGVCMEFGGPADRPLRYYPTGARYQVWVGDEGRVWMSRLDPTVLIANLPERDIAAPAAPPTAPWTDFGPGVEDPRPAIPAGPHSNPGIY